MGKNKHSGRKANNTPKQLANLRSTDKMTPEERRAFSQKGVAARNAKREQARNFKKAALWLMELPAFRDRANESEIITQLLKEFPDLNNAEAMTAAVMVRAIVDGDPKAFATIRDTTGELPAQTVNLQNTEPMTINIKTI